MIRVIHKDHGAGTSSVGLICRKKIIRRYQAKLVAYPIINWILLCIADPLEQRRFPSVCPTDNKDAEVGIFDESRSFFRGIRVAFGHAQSPRSTSKDLLQSIGKFGLWSNRGRSRIRATLRCALRSKSKDLLQSIGKFGLFGSLGAFISHIDYRCG